MQESGSVWLMLPQSATRLGTAADGEFQATAMSLALSTNRVQCRTKPVVLCLHFDGSVWCGGWCECVSCRRELQLTIRTFPANERGVIIVVNSEFITNHLYIVPFTNILVKPFLNNSTRITVVTVFVGNVNRICCIGTSVRVLVDNSSMLRCFLQFMPSVYQQTITFGQRP